MTPLRNLIVYETVQKVYCVAEDDAGTFRVLKFDRNDGEELLVAEDPHNYSQHELNNLLNSLQEGNARHGGLRKVAGPCAALVGCFRWTSCHYLLLVTRTRSVGSLCGAAVFGIDDTLLVRLAPRFGPRGALLLGGAAPSPAEQRYLHLLQLVSLTHDFFFSYDWPLWRTVQQALSGGGGAPDSGFNSDRVWNEAITLPLRSALGHDRWTVPLIHGFWQQRTLSLLGSPLTITLIARRSRRFAGTRYHRRGINDQGHVANDCEVEQVVETGVERRAGGAAVSSMVQVRGSVPLFWSQGWENEGAGRLRPSIRMLVHLDPLCTATKRHFNDLRERFGDPIVCLNLVKQADKQHQECDLGREYAAAVGFVNRTSLAKQRLMYVPWDFRQHAKALGSRLLAELQRMQAPLLESTGVFVTSPGRGAQRAQHGVLRTSCVDCLDRTNVAQFAFGLLALGTQLHTLGLAPSSRLDPESSMADQLMGLYEGMGDALAQQYGGSYAHASFFQRRRGDWQPAMRSRDLLTSVRRFYSNAVTDEDKQQAIDLFLEGAGALPAAVAPQWGGRPRSSNEEAPPPAMHAADTLACEASSDTQTPTLAEVLHPSDGDVPPSAPLPAAEPVMPAPASSAEAGPPYPPGTEADPPRAGEGAWSMKLFRREENPKLESFTELLPAGSVRPVRLTPALKPRSSWLPPRRPKSPPPEPAPITPPAAGVRGPFHPTRLVRSSSDSGMMTITQAARVAAGKPATAAAYRNPRDLGGSLVLVRASSAQGLAGGQGGEELRSVRSAGAGPSSPVLPRAAGSYHTLAGLNLEGVSLPPAPSAATPLPEPAPGSAMGARRLSFASLAGLGRLVMRGARPTTAPPTVAAPQGDAAGGGDTIDRTGSWSQREQGTGSSWRRPRPLDMTTVMYQREAVRRGVDDLGLPPLLAPLWTGQADPVAALTDLANALREELAGTLRGVAMPRTAEEYAALEKAAAAQLRPTVAASVSAAS